MTSQNDNYGIMSIINTWSDVLFQRVGTICISYQSMYTIDNDIHRQNICRHVLLADVTIVLVHTRKTSLYG